MGSFARYLRGEGAKRVFRSVCAPWSERNSFRNRRCRLCHGDEVLGLPGLCPGPRTRGQAPSPLRGFTPGPPETTSGSWDLKDGLPVSILDSDSPARPRIPSRRRRLGGSPGRWSAGPGPPATPKRVSSEEQSPALHGFDGRDSPSVPVAFDLSASVEIPEGSSKPAIVHPQSSADFNAGQRRG